MNEFDTILEYLSHYNVKVTFVIHKPLPLPDRSQILSVLGLSDYDDRYNIMWTKEKIKLVSKTQIPLYIEWHSDLGRSQVMSRLMELSHKVRPVEKNCPRCGSLCEWIECDCNDGFSHHDCGEDTCCCLDPEPNVICDTCDGEGGWWYCSFCEGSK